MYVQSIKIPRVFLFLHNDLLHMMQGLLAFHDVALKQTNAAGVALSLRR